jgi:hypothetical protein
MSKQENVGMIIERIVLIISGDNLDPEKLAKKLLGGLIVDYMIKPEESYERGGEIFYFDHGTLFLQHPLHIYFMGGAVVDYLGTFVEYIDSNYKTIKEFGGEVIVLDYHIYTSEDINSFSLIPHDETKILGQCNVDVNLTIYNFEEEGILRSFGEDIDNQKRLSNEDND